MRHIVLLDEKIPEHEYRAWLKEDKAFWKLYFNVDAKYFPQRHDFSTYPTYIDTEGDQRPTYSYLKSLAKKATQGYGPAGADFIIMAVHEDNFLSDNPKPGVGIWGTNYSNIHHGYHFQYCRWDRDNSANTFGTLYHERAHSFDALIANETNKNLNTIVGTRNWDAEFVHGGSKRFDYIRHKENVQTLRLIAPAMREAFSKRVALHIDYISGRVTLWQRLIELVTHWRNRTDTTNF